MPQKRSGRHANSYGKEQFLDQEVDRWRSGETLTGKPKLDRFHGPSSLASRLTLMPMFILTVHNGDNVPQADFFEASGLHEARSQTVIMAGDLLREADGDFCDQGANWRIDVADERGLVLYSILVVGIGSAAVGTA